GGGGSPLPVPHSAGSGQPGVVVRGLVASSRISMRSCGSSTASPLITGSECRGQTTLRHPIAGYGHDFNAYDVPPWHGFEDPARSPALGVAPGHVSRRVDVLSQANAPGGQLPTGRSVPRTGLS